MPRKIRLGTVISNKMEQTVVVAVETTKRHRLYHKRLRRTSHYFAHDAENACRIGDEVSIGETRPLSRLKRWEVLEILHKGDVAEVQPRAIGVEMEHRAPAPAAIAVEAATPVVAGPVAAVEAAAPAAAAAPESAVAVEADAPAPVVAKVAAAKKPAARAKKADAAKPEAETKPAPRTRKKTEKE